LPIFQIRLNNKTKQNKTKKQKSGLILKNCLLEVRQ
jgi:hypothetical protein